MGTVRGVFSLPKGYLDDIIFIRWMSGSHSMNEDVGEFSLLCIPPIQDPVVICKESWRVCQDSNLKLRQPPLEQFVMKLIGVSSTLHKKDEQAKHVSMKDSRLQIRELRWKLLIFPRPG